MSTEEELINLRSLVAKKNDDQLVQKEEIISAKDLKITKLEDQLEWLKKQVFGAKSERTIVPNNQEDIFGKNLENIDSKQAPKQVVTQHERKIKGHGRNELPDSLEEEVIQLELNESERICSECNTPMCSCGEETSYRLAIRSQYVKIKTVRIKYSCKAHPESGVLIAPVAPAYIPKGILTESTIAHSIVEKYEWHNPLERQEKKMEREGILVSATTLLDCQKKVALDIDRVFNAIKNELLTSDILYSDDTKIPVISDEKRKTKSGFFWTWSDGNKWALFDYSSSRSKTDPLKFLGNWRGYLHSDAYSVYDVIHKNGVTPVYCWAHVRRKYFEAVKAGNKLAVRPMSLINRIFYVDRAIKNNAKNSVDNKSAIRNRISKKLEETLFEWCRNNETSILPSSRLGEAVSYYRNQRHGLLTFLQDSRLSLDNNLSERNLRGIVIGRKNWLFAGNDESAKRAAVFCSIIASCKLQNIDPKKYFEAFMKYMATNPVEINASDLMPGKLAI